MSISRAVTSQAVTSNAAPTPGSAPAPTPGSAPAGTPGSAPAGVRCAMHPGRAAVDACPVCLRPCCGVDLLDGQPGCGSCRRAVEDAALRASAPPAVLPGLEPYIRAALAGTFAAVLGGLVTSEYIGAPFFAYVAPFLVGVLCGGAALRSARTDGRGVLGGRIRAIGVAYALLGVGVGFKVVPGGGSAFSPVSGVVLPYLCAAVGAVLWTMPPKRRGPRR